MYSEKSRLPLIRDGLMGLPYLWPKHEVFLYPFADYLQLLFQRPLVITIWKADSPKPIFSSLCDDYLINQDQFNLSPPDPHMVRVGESEYSIAVHSIQRNTLKPYVVGYHALKKLLAPPSKAANQIERDLFKEFLQILGESIKCFEAAVHERAERYRIREKSNLKTISAQDAKKMLEPMRAVLDRVYQSAGESPFLWGIDRKGLDLANLFAVVRVLLGNTKRYYNSFDFTAGLLLSRAQRETLDEWRTRTAHESGSDCVEVLETILGPNSRSIADYVFCSGVVGFSGTVAGGTLDFAGDPEDKCRQVEERRIYKQVAGQWPLYPFYIPIHVGGVPWISLFTLTDEYPGEDPRSWNHNYHLYRDVIPRAAEQIRVGAEEVYISSLASKLTEHLREWGSRAVLSLENIAKQVSLDWASLAQIYPFDRVTLEVAQPWSGKVSDENIIGLPGNGFLVVNVISDGSLFRRDLNYRLLDKRTVVRECRTAVAEYLRTTEPIQLRSLALTTHILKNPLSELKNLAYGIAESKLQDATLAKIDELIALETFSNYLIKSKAQLKPRSLVERPPSSVTSTDEFLKIVQQTIEKKFDIYQNVAFADNRAKIAQEIRALHAFLVHVDADERPLLQSYVQFFPLQINAVVDGLIDNALKYHSSERRSLQFRLNQVDHNYFLDVLSAVDGELEELRARAESLTHCRDLDWIGVSIVHLACEACDFAPPIWSIEISPDGAEQRKLLAKVQVGKIVENERR